MCFPVGSHWLEHSVQMLKSGKAELVHEVDETLIDIRTSLEDINNLSNFLDISIISDVVTHNSEE